MLSSPSELLANHAPAADVQTTRGLLLLLFLFAGSGCSALIYEIVWYQLLQFSIGSTAVSLAILLATFMGGLCIGSIALPRLKLSNHHPLKIYAALEFGIGQWLWFHGMTLVCIQTLLTTGVTASSWRRGEQFLLWLG